MESPAEPGCDRPSVPASMAMEVNDGADADEPIDVLEVRHEPPDRVFPRGTMFRRKSVREAELFNQVTGGLPALMKLHVNTRRTQMAVPIHVDQTKDTERRRRKF